MGRITLFVTESCSHCIRAKHALEERGIPFEVISVSTFPERRKDMLSLSNQLTVPQVFFNEEHVGGASDLLALLATWDGDTGDTSDKKKGRSSILSLSSSVSSESSTTSSTINAKKGAKLSLSKSPKGSAPPPTTPAQQLWKYMTPLEIYHKEVQSKPDPTDARLALISPELIEQRNKEHSDDAAGGIPPDICAFGCFVLPDGQAVSVRELLNDLMTVLPCEKLPYLAKYYVNCFPGKEGVDSLLRHYQPHLKTREDAVAFGLALQQYGVLHHVCDEHPFSDTGSLYFRLQPYHEPSVLNSFQKSHRCTSLPVKIPNTNNINDKKETALKEEEKDQGTCPATTTTMIDPMILIKKLRNILQTLNSKYTDSQGMDYIAARNSPEFTLLEEAACEVQCVNMADMNDTTKTAFGLNLYNVMIQHAFIKVGIAKSGSQRGAFFSGVCYNVGGHILSMDDLEHGILRANTRHPYALSPPLVEKERRALAVSDFDPRIHFALNCGANSCPPVNYYTPEALDEELRIASMSFCEHESNVSIKEEKMELHLSKIFHWYKSDFLKHTKPTTNTKPQMPLIILSFLRGEKKEKLQRMMNNGRGLKNNAIKIKYLPYDWGTNASQSADFHSRVLTKTQKSLLAALQRYATNEVVAPPSQVITRRASERVIQSLETTNNRTAKRAENM